jgi:hypothetical protein
MIWRESTGFDVVLIVNSAAVGEFVLGRKNENLGCGFKAQPAGSLKAPIDQIDAVKIEIFPVLPCALKRFETADVNVNETETLSRKILLELSNSRAQFNGNWAIPVARDEDEATGT